jgi:hypothetical protein
MDNELLLKIISKSLTYIKSNDYKSFDLFDAMTAKWLDKLTLGKCLLRRIFIQINSKSPFDLHCLGMRKIVHTKLISDLLWYYSLNKYKNSADEIYLKLLELRISGEHYVWCLNFPYTSRFVDAKINTPNIYNTATVGISICEYFSKTDNLDFTLIENISNSIFKCFKFNNEADLGWIEYYPNQKWPTYNVNALAAYFFTKANNTVGYKLVNDDIILKLLNLLIQEQNEDGSWYYSRSEKGKWIDGFHTGFILESLAYIYANYFTNHNNLKECLDKAYDYYVKNLFTADGFPKYFINNSKYPIESQNCAQAIQTLSVLSIWTGRKNDDLLDKVVKNVLENLYDTRGFFYYKRTANFTYKQSYLRWSTSPMIVALKYYELSKISKK